MKLVAICIFALAAIGCSSLLFGQTNDNVRTLVYELHSERWTSFAIPPGTRRVRILTTPLFASRALIAASTNQARYELRYTLGTDSLHARTVEFIVTPSQPPTQASGTELIPGGSRSHTLDLPPNAGTVSLRLKTSRLDPHLIQSVVARCYLLEKIDDDKLRLRWRRLSAAERAKAIRGNVYPEHLLAEDELANAMRFRWRPIGPQGVAGADFRRVEILLAAEKDWDQTDALGFSSNDQIVHAQRATVFAVENRYPVRFVFYPLGSPEANKISLVWFGRTDSTRVTNFFQTSGRIEISTNFPTGHVELRSEAPLAVEAFRMEGTNSFPLFRAGEQLRLFRLDPSHPLVFSVLPGFTNRSPLRVELRAMALTNRMAALAARVELLDASEKPIFAAILTNSLRPSAYDTVRSTNAVVLSERRSYFFFAPTNVTTLRLSSSSDQPLLAGLSSRPFTVPHRVSVPASHDDDQSSIPIWFPVRPKNYDSLVQDGSVLIQLQVRPPEPNIELLSGEVAYQPLAGSVPLLQRALLVEGESDGFSSDTYRRFASVPKGVPMHQNLRADSGDRLLSPRVIWVQPSQSPFALSVRLDEVQLPAVALAGQIGEWFLPKTHAGTHTVQMEASASVSVFLNGMENGTFRKRIAWRADQPLVFVHDRRRQIRESLAARLFAPIGETNGTRIRIHIRVPEPEAAGPFSDWTLRHRIVEADSAEGQISVLNTPGFQTDRGQPFFIPIGAEIPAGPVEIELQVEPNTGRYLLLSALHPAPLERDSLRIENYTEDFPDD